MGDEPSEAFNGLGAAGEDVIRRVAYDEIVDASWQSPARLGALGSAGLKDLMDLIFAQGVLVPLLVRPVAGTPQAQPRYECIAGHRRLHAVRALARANRLRRLHPADRTGHLDSKADRLVPVIVRAVDDVTARTMTLLENLERKSLSQWEKSVAVAEIARAMPAAGETPNDRTLARRTGLSGPYATELWRIGASLNDDDFKQAGYARTLAGQHGTKIEEQVVDYGPVAYLSHAILRAAMKYKEAGEIEDARRVLSEQLAVAGAKHDAAKTRLRNRDHGEDALEVPEDAQAELVRAARSRPGRETGVPTGATATDEQRAEHGPSRQADQTEEDAKATAAAARWQGKPRARAARGPSADTNTQARYEALRDEGGFRVRIQRPLGKYNRRWANGFLDKLAPAIALLSERAAVSPGVHRHAVGPGVMLVLSRTPNELTEAEAAAALKAVDELRGELQARKRAAAE